MSSIKQLPNSVAVFILGICSILFGCFLIGMITGIIGLVLAGKDKRLHKSNPEEYSGYGLLNAGYIMSIIGVVFSGLWVLYFLFYIIILGGLVTGLGGLTEILDSL